MRLRELGAAVSEIHRVASAVTCAIPATRRPEHMSDYMDAMKGSLPDAALRQRMLDYC